MSVLGAGKLGTELENVTAAARKDILRESAMQKEKASGEREEVSKEEKKMTVEQKAKEWE